jgi:hypothetical protein
MKSRSPIQILEEHRRVLQKAKERFLKHGPGITQQLKEPVSQSAKSDKT